MVTRSMLCALVTCCGFSAVASASPWYAEVGVSNPNEGNVALGYQIRPYLGLEAGYRRAEEGFDFPVTPSVRRRLGEIDGFEVALRGTVQVSPRFALTGRFGLYEWDVEYPNFHAPSGQNLVYKRDSVSPIVGAGLRAGLTERLHFTAEYTSVDTYVTDGMFTVGLRAEF